jgi:predicted porin
LAATASFAQSSVQIDGIVDAGFQAIDYKGTKVNGIAGNGSSTSQLNIRGTEDLGGGLKADFRVETDWNAVSNNANTGAKKADGTLANGSTFGNGEIRVGLAGGFGRVDLGAVNSNTLGPFTTGQPFGTAIGSGFRAVTWNDTQGLEASVATAASAAGSQVRAENAIKYTTPVFSGFNATLYKSNKQTKAGGTTPANFSTSLGAYDQVGTQEIGVNYANGPLAASFSQLKQDSKSVGSLTSESTVNTLGANYTMGAAKLFGLYQDTKFKSGLLDGVKAQYWALSGTYTMGAVVLMASYGELKDKSANSDGEKSKLTALGADYNLSKRTALYARYETINDKMGIVPNPSTLAATGDKRTRTAFGLRHAF